MDIYIAIAVVLGVGWYASRNWPAWEGRERPSLAQVNQVLLFVVLAGVILFALGIVRCEAVITT